MTVTSELGLLWSLKELSVHFDNERSFVERITFFSLNILPPVSCSGGFVYWCLIDILNMYWKLEFLVRTKCDGNSAVSCRPTEAMCLVAEIEFAALRTWLACKILMLIWTVSQSDLAAQTSVLSQEGHSTEWELLHPAVLAEPRVALGTGLSWVQCLGGTSAWGGTSACVLTVAARPDLTARRLFTWKIWLFPGDCKMQR